jgi:thioredoxin reductase (NADPH)
VYAAGDIALKPLRQLVTAAADGATAIYSIQNYLMEQM